MRLEIDVALEYQIFGDPMVLLSVEAAQTEGQTILSQELAVENGTLSWVAGEGGLGTRVWANVQAPQLRLRYRASVDVTRQNVPLESLAAVPKHDLPGEAVTYLRPSRFCQSDMFTAFVARRFGDLQGGAKIAAISDWVKDEMVYVPFSSHVGTTVLDTFAAREGVCRDYTHMVCALARAADIPARYTSVYGADVNPPDFHAVAQVYLEGGWHLVDASGMCQPDAMVVIGAGRDACDVPFMESAAQANLINQWIMVYRGQAAS